MLSAADKFFLGLLLAIGFVMFHYPSVGEYVAGVYIALYVLREIFEFCQAFYQGWKRRPKKLYPMDIDNQKRRSDK